MIRVIRALEVIKAGNELANPGAWKNAQAWTNVVTVLFMLAQEFGFGLAFGESHFETIGYLIVFLFNVYLTLATSKKVGL